MRISRYRVAGAAMLAVGALLLMASGGYYAYAQFAKTSRGDLVHEVSRPTLSTGSSGSHSATGTPGIRPEAVQPQVAESGTASRAVSNLEPGSSTTASTEVVRIDTGSDETVVSDAAAMSSSDLSESNQDIDATPRVDVDATVQESLDRFLASDRLSIIAGNLDGRVRTAIEALQLLQARRPGYVIREPESQVEVSPTEPTETNGPSPSIRIIQRGRDRDPVANSSLIAELQEGAFARATQTTPDTEFASRMIVEGIGLRASVKELEVIEEGDSRAWETPKHIVGHIPTTSRPGASGQGWYFGHLESPISGEGNIFHRLPELASRFKKGEQFNIQLDAGTKRYVYQVYRTDVVHASEFAVSDSGLSDITLVACWPQYEYSERVLVTAALVNVVDIPESERIQPASGES